MAVRYATPKGKLVGWKIAYRRGCPVLLKLHIPSYADVICGHEGRNALRSRTTDKRRASHARVVGVFRLARKGEAGGRFLRPGRMYSSWDSKFCYYINRTAKAKKFDYATYWTCSSGIHFFLSKQAALDYY